MKNGALIKTFPMTQSSSLKDNSRQNEQIQVYAHISKVFPVCLTLNLCMSKKWFAVIEIKDSAILTTLDKTRRTK